MTELSDVDQLFDVRQRVGDVVDLAERGLSRTDALAVQLRVADRYADRGDPVAGWKVAYTSGDQRDRMGAGYRAFGFVPASRVLTSGVTVPLAAFARPGIEIELCLRVGDNGEAAAVAPAFELTDRRIRQGADDGTVLADGCSNWGVVVGEFRQLPPGPLTDLEVRLCRAGEPVATFRPGDTMDDPLLSLRRLHERLGDHGRDTTPGQCVITGSIVKAPVTGPGPWSGEIDGLGTVELTFA